MIKINKWTLNIVWYKFFSKKNVVSKLSKIYKAKNNKENDVFFKTMLILNDESDRLQNEVIICIKLNNTEKAQERK